MADGLTRGRNSCKQTSQVGIIPNGSQAITATCVSLHRFYINIMQCLTEGLPFSELAYIGLICDKESQIDPNATSNVSQRKSWYVD